MKKQNINILIYLFIILIILYFYVFFYQIPYKKNLKNENYLLMNNFFKTNEIPNDLYLMWHTSELPYFMNQNYQMIKKNNPDIHFHLYDLSQCRQFIEQNFSQETLQTFDKLKPYAYKSDLWRYCILYKKGGIYMDIKFTPIDENLRFSSLLDKEYFCIDWSDKTKGNHIDYSEGITNGFIVSKPNNPIFKKCIDQIIDNVKHNYYGLNSLYPTGPMLLNRYFTTYMKHKLILDLYKDEKGEITLRKNKISILKYYNQYREEQENNTDIPHYGELWKNKDIYII